MAEADPSANENNPPPGSASAGSDGTLEELYRQNLELQNRNLVLQNEFFKVAVEDARARVAEVITTAMRLEQLADRLEHLLTSAPAAALAAEAPAFVSSIPVEVVEAAYVYYHDAWQRRQNPEYAHAYMKNEVRGEFIDTGKLPAEELDRAIAASYVYMVVRGYLRGLRANGEHTDWANDPAKWEECVKRAQNAFGANTMSEDEQVYWLNQAVAADQRG